MINYKIALQKNHPKSQHFNHFSQMKLPLIDKRATQNMKKSLSKIRSGKLPTLNFNEKNVNHHENKRIAAVSELQRRSDGEPEDNSNFAHQIEQKMNEIANHNHLFNMDYYTNDGENFEQNIARNKQFLKEQREKRASIINKRKENETQSPKQDYSRRITQNLKKRQDRPKFMSKHKKRTESPAIQNSKSQSVLHNDEQTDKKKVIMGKDGITNRLQKKMLQLKKKLSKRKNGNQSKLATDGDVEQAKSQNLFDNIHNYLANPHRLSFDLKNITSSKHTSKRSALQAKIKAIQQKIQSLDKTPHKQKTAIINMQIQSEKQRDDYGISEWRRIQFAKTDESGRNILMKQSNFEKEINQLNILQQRNEHSLEKYLQNQRVLFDLKLIKSNSNKEHVLRQFRSK